MDAHHFAPLQFKLVVNHRATEQLQREQKTAPAHSRQRTHSSKREIKMPRPKGNLAGIGLVLFCCVAIVSHQRRALERARGHAEGGHAKPNAQSGGFPARSRSRTAGPSSCCGAAPRKQELCACWRPAGRAASIQLLQASQQQERGMQACACRIPSAIWAVAVALSGALLELPPARAA